MEVDDPKVLTPQLVREAEPIHNGRGEEEFVFGERLGSVPSFQHVVRVRGQLIVWVDTTETCLVDHDARLDLK